MLRRCALCLNARDEAKTRDGTCFVAPCSDAPIAVRCHHIDPYLAALLVISKWPLNTGSLSPKCNPVVDDIASENEVRRLRALTAVARNDC